MTFEFVDHNAGINDASRRRIRRQAAKGHNAGRTVVRVSQKKQPHSRPGALLEAGVTRPFSQVDKGVGDSFGCAIFLPHVTTAESRSVVHRVTWIMTNPFCRFALQRALTSKTIAPSPWWVQMMFVDEAYYHAIAAACLIVYNNAVQRKAADVYRHCDTMLHLLNAKLSGEDAVSDATIATVIMASQYERYRGSYSSGTPHMDGMQRMIGMRGGIKALARQNAALTYKMFRADLEYSLHLGTRTRLSLSDVLFAIDASDALQSLVGTGVENISRGLGEQLAPEEAHRPLRVLHAEVKALAALLNDAEAGRRPKLDMRGLHHAFLTVGYRLLDIRPLGDPPFSDLADEALYAGLACTAGALLPGLDGRGARLPLMDGIVRSIVERGAGQVPEDETFFKTLLWVLFAAYAGGVFGDADSLEWLIPRVEWVKDVLDLRTWNSVRQVLDEFAWIHCLQETAGHGLWSSVEESKLGLCGYASE